MRKTALIIFGASGDLAERKLMPALWQLHLAGKLPERFAVVGYGRSELTDEAFRDKMRRSCCGDSADAPDAWDDFARRLRYVSGQYDDAEAYGRLDRVLRELQSPDADGQRDDADDATEAGVRLFYLSTPPGVYADIIRCVAGMPQPAGTERRVVVEKPFGLSLPEARDLNALLARHFDEEQVFRIDHYLGKETVQNILILRFTNAIFEPLWGRNHVAWVQITASEALGVEDRGGFYEQSGALRDMVQMHLLQLLALVAMEQPASFAADDIRDEKAKLLRMVRPLTADLVSREAVRGQYGPGTADGRQICGYRENEKVDDASPVETYAALRLWIDNWRWQGVPFYLRTGKALDRKATEIAIGFRHVPTCLFADRDLCTRIEPNVLVLRVAPREGAHLVLSSRIPGGGNALGGVKLDFTYAEAFDAEPPEAYETLLLDAIAGDTALFARRDQVELAWQIIQPVLDAWQAAPPVDFPNYAAGTRGPAAADRLLAELSHRWYSMGS